MKVLFTGRVREISIPDLKTVRQGNSSFKNCKRERERTQNNSTAEHRRGYRTRKKKRNINDKNLQVLVIWVH